MLLTDFREISRAVCASVFVSVCVRTQELTQTSTAPEVVLSRIFRHYEIIVCCIMCRASDSVFMTAECRAPDYLFRIAVCRESDFADYKSVPVRNCSWGFTFWGEGGGRGYVVATIIRLLKIIGVFIRIWSLL